VYTQKGVVDVTVTNTTPTSQTITLEAEGCVEDGTRLLLADGSIPLGEIGKGCSSTVQLRVTPLQRGSVPLGPIVLHAHTGARFKPAENLYIYSSPQ